MRVYVVEGFDVGGNNGTTIEGIFTTVEDATRWAHESPDVHLNMAGWPGSGQPFDVTAYELCSSFDEAMAEHAASEAI